MNMYIIILGKKIIPPSEFQVQSSAKLLQLLDCGSNLRGEKLFTSNSVMKTVIP